jgi:hypothetical protein
MMKPEEEAREIIDAARRNRTGTWQRLPASFSQQNSGFS